MLDADNTVPVATAFNRQSVLFDGLYAGNTIIQYKRKSVRAHVLKYLPAAATLLELNCGTGDDAAYFSKRGYRVHATDLATGMLEQTREKIRAYGLETLVSTELCDFEKLELLQKRGPYDHIFSNFAGLNCSKNLDKVLASFNPLLKPGGMITLVVMPGFCLWETLLVLKGKFRTAFRRFAGKRGSGAKVEGQAFRCWYYNPSYIRKHLGQEFTILSLQGLCTLVPPSYLEGFADRHPKIFTRLCNWEEKYGSRWPWNRVGDYYIITLQKKFTTEQDS